MLWVPLSKWLQVALAEACGLMAGSPPFLFSPPDSTLPLQTAERDPLQVERYQASLLCKRHPLRGGQDSWGRNQRLETLILKAPHCVAELPPGP